MNDREFFVSHLWDWLAEGDDFPDHPRMQQLLDSSPEFREEFEQVQALRSGIHELKEEAPQGFEAALQQRLKAHIATESQTGSLDGGGRVIQPQKSFWGRGSALLLTGVAAALLLVFVGRQDGGTLDSGIAQDPAARSGTSAAEEAEPAGILQTQAFDSFQDSLAGDSLRSSGNVDDLQPVSSTRDTD